MRLDAAAPEQFQIPARQIRRGLAKFGLTDVDLRGARLTNFSFSSNGIRSISGAVISDGLYFDDEMKNFAQGSTDHGGRSCSAFLRHLGHGWQS